MSPTKQPPANERGRQDNAYDEVIPVQSGGGYVVAPGGEEYACVDNTRKWNETGVRQSTGEDTTLVDNELYTAA